MTRVRATEYREQSDSANTDQPRFGDQDEYGYGAGQQAGRGAKQQLCIEWVTLRFPDGTTEPHMRLSVKRITSDEAAELYHRDGRKKGVVEPVDPEMIEWPVGCAFDIATHRPLAWLETAAPQEIRRALGAMRKTGERAAA